MEGLFYLRTISPTLVAICDLVHDVEIIFNFLMC